MYVVGRGRLKVGDGYREVGDPIPEAADWTNLRAYLQSGLVIAIEAPDDGPVVETSSSEAADDLGEAASILPPSLGRRRRRG